MAMTTFFNTAICLSDCVGAAYRPMLVSRNQNELHDAQTRSIQIRTIVNRVFYFVLTTLASSQGLLGAIKIASLSPAALLITTTITTLVMEIFTFYTILFAIREYVDHYTDGGTFTGSSTKESIRIIIDIAEHTLYYYLAYTTTGFESAVRWASAVIVTIYSPTLYTIFFTRTKFPAAVSIQ